MRRRKPRRLSSQLLDALRIAEGVGRKHMTIRSDPENNEIRALFDLVDFSGKDVLEIGCGDGRLTWRYAEAAAHVTGIDPFEEAIGRANANKLATLQDQVAFHHIAFEDFAAACDSELFDLAILSWSL
jgi:2-polyprenyl-3-methyl-5-hydroxy-6-metoxy-1,4-benzoquinol methylase